MENLESNIQDLKRQADERESIGDQEGGGLLMSVISLVENPTMVMTRPIDVSTMVVGCDQDADRCGGATPATP